MARPCNFRRKFCFHASSGSETEVKEVGGSSSGDVTKNTDIKHSLIFKCIGASKERIQEVLCLASQKINEGETVPVRM